uniref:Uncharacterized protein n=1 Tax=Anguilla anguilla TaxID=7936 RepID=A0A0E9RRC9_ANGAN
MGNVVNAAENAHCTSLFPVLLGNRAG